MQPPTSRKSRHFGRKDRLESLQVDGLESGPTRIVVVSDLHIGLPYFRRNAFLRFLSELPPDTTLVLNGDSIDDPFQELTTEDRLVVDRLRTESERRRVIWLLGNHDDGLELENPRRIEFARHFEIGKRLLIVHGDDFDEIMPRSRIFIRLFRRLHKMRLGLGASPVHVAETAKRWAPFLYRVLTEEVKKNAVNCALERGFEAITCGHVHYSEDSLVKGVRYLNTGCWTEDPLCYVEVSTDRIELRRIS